MHEIVYLKSAEVSGMTSSPFKRLFRRRPEPERESAELALLQARALARLRSLSKDQPASDALDGATDRAANGIGGDGIDGRESQSADTGRATSISNLDGVNVATPTANAASDPAGGRNGRSQAVDPADERAAKLERYRRVVATTYALPANAVGVMADAWAESMADGHASPTGEKDAVEAEPS